MRRRLKALLLVAVLFITILPPQTKKANAASWSDIAPGKYYLRNVATGKFLNVCDAGNWNNCNVDNWYFNGCNAQVWTISGSSSSYKVQPGCSSTRVLNQWGDNVISGHNVCLWDNTNHPSQRWVFQKVSSTICDSVYIIRCAGNTNCVLDVDENGNVCVCTYANRNSQKWILTNAEMNMTAGNNRIRNRGNQKYLAVNGAGDYNNCNVITSAWVYNASYQIWAISGGSGYNRIKPTNTVSRVLNQWGDNVVSGHNVCLWSDTGHPSQRWSFERIRIGGFSYYIIHCVGNPGCVLDVDANGNVYVNTYNGSDSQLWELITGLY